ncbi:MAG: hypothetical protein JWO58_639 [Chitinophagaceae bacterium]|nr:hypothetical protein [Chitinophagaceae bacterium]
MEKEELISIQQFCTHYNIEFSFLDSLQEFGLLEIVTIEETRFVPIEKIKDIEQFMRMHYELEINLEGIDAISHLLRQMTSLQQEIITLRNRLNRHEEE